MSDQGPTFLVIGAARSGTTALTTFLGQHPDVAITRPKEPHFFAFANRPQRFLGPGDDVMINHPMITDPARYRQLFEEMGDTQHRGDGSVSTLYYHQHSIDNIERYAPDARLIVLLRDPVERAFSSYLYLRGLTHETAPTFADGLSAEATRMAKGWHHMWHYDAVGRYHRQLHAFVDVFGRDRLHVILHDDFRRGPEHVMAGVSEFLGLDPFAFATSADLNRGGEPRSPTVAALMSRARASPAVRRMIERTVSAERRSRVRNRNLHHPAINPATALELRARYHDDIAATAALLGLDLSHWMTAE